MATSPHVWTPGELVTATSLNDCIPRITSGPMTGGPPANPQDGDFWIALAAGGNGENWTFRYNAGSSSAHKWEFFSGSPVENSGPTGNNWGAGWNNIGNSLVTPRNGDYRFDLRVSGVGHASTTQVVDIGVGTGTTTSAYGVWASVTAWAAQYFALSGISVIPDLAAGTACWLNGWTASAGAPAPLTARMTILPVRVS